MKHAYLIMAHNEFEHLQRLISALDDERNDIYVHIDRKIKLLPKLSSKKSQLHILENRVDVRWGHSSLLQAEHALLEKAYRHGYYDYYHIISGTHYPLKSVQEIEHYFANHYGKSVLCPMEWTESEIKSKLGRYHFFLRGIKDQNSLIRKISVLIWRGFLRLQRGWIKRDYSYFHEKCSNWVSISKCDIKIILDNWDELMKKIRYAFCQDEIAVPSILHANGVNYDLCKDLLYTEFYMANPKTLTLTDYNNIISSNCLFARKFSNNSNVLCDKIISLWRPDL